MWWIYIVAGAIFVLFLILKLVHHKVRSNKIVRMQAVNEYKKFFTLTFTKVPDARKVIYYSEGPMNIKYDPTNFDLYRTRMIQVPCYTYKEKKVKNFGLAWKIIYWIIFVLALLCCIISVVWQLLLKFAPGSIEFLNIEALEMTKTVFTYTGFAVSMALIALLAIIFILINKSYKKLFVSYMQIYFRLINNEVYSESMKPIYVKLDK